MKCIYKHFQFKISKLCTFVLNITRLLFSVIVDLIFFLLGERQSKSFSQYVISPAGSSLRNKKKWKTRTKDPFSATYSQYWEDLMRFSLLLLFLFFFISDSISLCRPITSHAMLNFSVCFVPQIKVIFAVV